MNYFVAILSAFVVSVICTPVVIWFASRFGFLDMPGDPRKIHKTPIPRLGGLAIFVSFFAVLAVFLSQSQVVYEALHQNLGVILPKHLWGIFVAGAVLMIFGALDDKYDLKPRYAFAGPILAALIIIGSGIGITFITNPLGGLFYLDQFTTTFLVWHGIPYRIFWLADIFTFVWLMGMMYTTKLLDGLDGLVTGVSGLGALFIFFLSLQINQPFTALMAAILFGANLGFLIFNFNPAKIFLGEGGSVWAGFMIGVLSIVSGGKVATAFLIMGLPLLDVVWIILRRLLVEKHSLATADKKHIHHRLLDAGLSQRSAVLILYFVTATFGLAALFLQSFGKLVAIGVLALTMATLGIMLILFKKPEAGMPLETLVKGPPEK